MRRILFLCTGNYYRSRFAEYLFNARAESRGLSWQATSRGLALERGADHEGPLSGLTAERLRRRGIAVRDLRAPLTAENDDFRLAQRIIALKEAEHRPLVQQRYPEFVDRVEYWHVHDLDPGAEYDPLTEIETSVESLILDLS